MAIKLKNWIKSTYKTNSNIFKLRYFIKYISLLIFYFSLSTLFEITFNQIYNAKILNDYHKMYSIPRFYLFGPIIKYIGIEFSGLFSHLSHLTSTICIISLILFILNRGIKSDMEIKFFKYLSTKFIDNFLLSLIILIFIRYVIWKSTISFYDTELIICNFLLLVNFYLLVNYIAYNNCSLKGKFKTSKTLNNLFVKGGDKVSALFFIFAIFQCLVVYVVVNSVPKTLTLLSITIALILICNYLLYYITTKKIGRVADGLNNAIDKQVKSEKMKTELITNVSHDLKTPLTSILNYVDIIKNNDLDQDTLKDYINILDKKSKRLKTLVDDIFEASKLSSGDIELSIEKTDIKELLIQSIVELDDKIEESKLDFNINTPDTNVFSMVDGKKTWRVFENLIINIIKYSMPYTRVYIDMEVENNHVYITFKNISNHKLNISPNELLDRFRRGDVSRHTDGSGLGLSISQEILNLQSSTLDLNIDGDLFKVKLTFHSV